MVFIQTLLHVHSENSLKECALKIDSILKKAQEAGYRKVVLADTGNMTGAIEFYKKAPDYGIEPVIGVECLMEEESGFSRAVLAAKNKEGYLALCKIVTAANANLSKEGRPVTTKDMLAGAASACPGSLVAFSGGKDGFLTYPIIRNREYASAAGKQEETSSAEADAGKKESLEKQIDEIRQGLEAKRKEKKDAQKKLKAAQAAKELGMADGTAEAEQEVKRLTSVIDRFIRMKKTVEKELGAIMKEEEQISRSRAEREKAAGMVKGMAELREEVTGRCLFFKELFGPDFYAEYAFHQEEGEAEMLALLKEAAAQAGVGAVLSNTPYTLDGSEDEVLRWHLISSLMDNEWVPVRKASSFYGILAGDELKGRFAGILTEEEVNRAAHATDKAFESCGLTLDTGGHYPKYPVPEGKTAAGLMEERARARISSLYPGDAWDDEHEKRFLYEVSVIEKSGYSDYTLTIADILEEARSMADPHVVSCLVGPGRGSGAGSIVNYLMGITSLDPMKYSLIFERYLNIERVSPPDIDSDIATSIREALVGRIIKKYSRKEGSIGVCNILTKSKLTGKAAVKAAGRILSSRYYGNTTALYGLADRMSKSLPSDNRLKLKDHEAELKEAFWSKEAHEVLRFAMLLEGAVWAYGTHAAGVIISDNGDITDYAPLINIGTKEAPVWNIQCDMVEAEGLGLLKMDMLGLKTLDTCYETLLMAYRRYGKKIDLFHIPFEKEVFHEIYCKGLTNGVFQCESAGMKRMWMDLKPDNIEDIIAGIALYRPGPMEFIADYIRGKENSSGIVYKTEKLRPILENTYGCIVYQEQVMQIVRDLAGYSMGRSDLVRRAMSKKKDSVMQQERRNFVYGNEAEGIRGCVNNGIPAETADSIYDDMVDFAKYAFNKSHAAAYALVSYQTAWLKYHYPEEFMACAMNAAVEKDAGGKLPSLLHECARMGIPVHGPDINCSMQGFSVHGGELYFGIGTVKSVRENAGRILQERGMGFTGYKDFLLRTKVNRTALKNLVKAGAFTGLHRSRGGLLRCMDGMLKIRDRILSLEEKAGTFSRSLEAGGMTGKERARKEAQLVKYREELYAAKKEWEEYRIPETVDTVSDKLAYEKETLFAYITTHPMDAYDERPGCVCLGGIGLEDAGSRGILAMGCITGLKVMESKNDGRKMAVFTLQDKTGEQKCICFPFRYGQYGEHLKEGCVVSVYCNVTTEKNDKESLLLAVDRVEMMEPDLDPVVLSVPEVESAEGMVKEKAGAYLVEQGHPLFLHIRDGARPGRLVSTGLFVYHTITEGFGKEEVQMAKIRKRRKAYGAETGRHTA